MGAIFTYIRIPYGARKAQSAGLSPSPTDESALQKVLGSANEASSTTAQNEPRVSVSNSEAERAQVAEPQQPESNDTSYGVEATAVRTLAASTGTVAILGTTAKVKESETPEHVPATTAQIQQEGKKESTAEKEINEKLEKPEVKTEEHETVGNEVLKQKELKQIENEAIQEKASELQSQKLPKDSSKETEGNIPTSVDERSETAQPHGLEGEESPPDIPKEGSKQEEKIQIDDTLQESKIYESVSIEVPELSHVPRFGRAATEDVIERHENIVRDASRPIIVDVQEKRDVIHSKLRSSSPEVIEDINGSADEDTSQDPVDPSKPFELIIIRSDDSISAEKTGEPPDADISPDGSRTDDENDISSERLKTTSLSDMSLSETAEGEEAAREAAKALELQEMVASLSESAKQTQLDLDLARHVAAMHSAQGPSTSVMPVSQIFSLRDLDAQLPELDEGIDFEQSQLSLSTIEPVTQIIHVSDTKDSMSNSKSIEEPHIEEPAPLSSSPLLEKLEENVVIADPQEGTEETIEADDQLVSAVTTIQSSFRGYKTRKELKSGLMAEDEENGNKVSPQSEDEEGEEAPPDDSEPQDITIANAPLSLVKIAQAEVDKICYEAEKLMTPPPATDTDNEPDDTEEFPAPPDELLESTDKNDTIKDDQDSSGTDPTIPLGTNNTEGDSSKTEDTTAPSLAESEIKSTNGRTSAQPNDENKMESSITDNFNTEIAVNRDSTEGELTMDEDLKEEDVGAVLEGMKADFDASGNVDLKGAEQAATVIQAGYRGFKTRKELKKRKEKDNSSNEGSKMTSPTGTTDLSEGSNKGLSPEAEKEGTKSIEPQETSEQAELISVSSDTSPTQGESPISVSLREDLKMDIKRDSSSSTTFSEEELNEKARKIQAGVRGYLVRKENKAKREAAVKIQSTFRGFKTRQRLKNQEIS